MCRISDAEFRVQGYRQEHPAVYGAAAPGGRGVERPRVEARAKVEECRARDKECDAHAAAALGVWVVVKHVGKYAHGDTEDDTCDQRARR